MLIRKDKKIHVKLRRNFETDIRRHFVGKVLEATDQAVLVEGYVFIFASGTNNFIRKGKMRHYVVSLVDASNIIHLMPDNVNLDEIVYKNVDQGLIVTDGKSFEMDINEFGSTR